VRTTVSRPGGPPVARCPARLNAAAALATYNDGDRAFFVQIAPLAPLAKSARDAGTTHKQAHDEQGLNANQLSNVLRNGSLGG